MYRKHGFTLVEILFVVLIAAGVLAFAVPAYKRTQERSTYNAALGALLDFSNAVNSLKKDIELATGTSFNWLDNNEAFKWNLTSKGTKPQQNVLLGSNDELYTWIANLSKGDSIRKKGFTWALVKFGYFKPLQDGNTISTKYDFYVLNGNPASGDCKLDSVPAGKIPVACMYLKSTQDRTGCYVGAIVYNDGTVQREKGSKCK